MANKRGIVAAWLCAAFMAAVGTVFVFAATAVVAQAAAIQTETVSIGGNPDFDEMNGGASRNIPMSLSFGGFHRTFLVHVPTKYSGDKSVKLPVLVMLHAAGGDGATAVKQTGWDRKADEETFLAVFPDALPENPQEPASAQKNPRLWNDGSNRQRGERLAIDDIGFIGAALDAIAQRYPVDANRVYITGFGSGGSMAFRAASSALAARIAAVAPVSGYFYAAGDPVPPRPVPLLLIVGTDDPVNPIQGGHAVRLRDGAQTEKPSVTDTVTAWAKLDGCTITPALISDEDGVKRLAYGPGRDGVEFLYWTVKGMGHHWPGSKTEQRPRSVVGDPSNKLSTDSIWTFLSRHTLALRADAT